MLICKPSLDRILWLSGPNVAVTVFFRATKITRVWRIYYLALVKAVSLASPFFWQAQHLAKGVSQACAVLR